MAEAPSDPPDARTLFSPVRIVDNEPSSDAPLPGDTPVYTSEESKSSSLEPTRNRLPYVSVPVLSSAQKDKYRLVLDDSVESDEEFPQDGVDCVVGESQERGGLFFYVRYVGDLIYKLPSRSFQRHHSDLVKDYERARALGTLPDFDPTSAKVHTGSRQATAPVTIKIPGKKSRRTPQDEYSSDELAGGVESDSSEESIVSGRRRTATRAAAAIAKTKFGSRLPFSPRKTRSGGHAISISTSDSDVEMHETARLTRKSTRVRKSRRSNLDDDEFQDFTPADDSDTYTDKKAVKKKVVRGKASRPAYGHFRVVADLQYDEQENEDIASLIAHRNICEKCHTTLTHEQLSKKGRKRKAKADDSEDEDTRLANLGGWVRCLKCPVAAHWGCLAKTQRDEILRAAHERDKAAWRSAGSNGPEPLKRTELDIYQTTEFICGSCMKGGICMGCKEVALRPDQFAERAQSTLAQAPSDAAQGPSTVAITPSAIIADPMSAPPEGIADGESLRELLFRCFTCKRLAHYAHLPVPDGYDPDEASAADIASYYQHETEWKCSDCASYVYTVERILAWRPYPENAVEPPRPANEPPYYKSMLPRDYLVKWTDRSYRRVQWVPHGWLLAVAPNKLRNFLTDGPKIALLPEPVSEQQLIVNGESHAATFEIGDESEGQQGGRIEDDASLLVAIPDAERKIPPAWKTVDRVLDVLLWRPRKAPKGKKKAGVDGSDENGGSDEEDAELVRLRDAAYDQGEKPDSHAMVDVEKYESLTREKLSDAHVSQVAWAFFKWDDLGYEDASWDSPPRQSDIGYAAFDSAFKRFIFARSVTVPTKDKRDKKTPAEKRGVEGWLLRDKFTVDNQPQLGQSPQIKLMDFQITGVNWLCFNWNKSQNCILADEMGLGKTVQIVTFIGFVVKTFKSYPALVVVPNSTITNWVREFERWAPKLRVVPFYGEVKAREVIKRYELSHPHPAQGTTGAKYHVLITTYETITNTKEFGPVFKSTPRWEMLVVDEGQRLKSDESMIFRRLKELNSFHRIIMTGTPLNNNIRELFNLMNFLDPDEWKDLEALSKQYEELTDELVAELHVRLKPYFLRRIKSEVLQLPPKNEVIVPVSMASLQKEIYRSILSQNLDILRSLAEGNAASSSKGNGTLSKTNMNNMLMQLRKCLQHPYLVSDTIEPRDLSPHETHERLIGASAKIRFLRMLLPKLRARNHRVLLFSQFVIALDIVEDFLTGEGVKFLRLDGNTKQADRQKDMDEFNKPDSDVSIYLLTTRAGGVGINLWSADTVIIFDPDFNPHQDLQAIARAHRYGQKKTVLVFKLMVKDSAEERIMQTGKKKLILDHLIVQKMDDETGTREDVQSILMFGAKALFEDTEESAAREVHYSENDIDKLIEKTEKEGDVVEPESGSGSMFAFAKVWSADKDGLEELTDDVPEYTEETDSWAKALELIATRKAAEQTKEATGRGVRRKAAAVFSQQQSVNDLGHTPPKDQQGVKSRKKKKKSQSKSAGSDDSDFHAPLSDAASDSDTDNAAMDVDDIMLQPVPYVLPLAPVPEQHHNYKQLEAPDRPRSPIQMEVDGPEELCGLCRNTHGPGHCPTTESPENLALYRLMLIQHAGDETIEERRNAIRYIDETLHRLGKVHLIYGQPLHLVEVPVPSSPAQPQKKPKLDDVGAHPVSEVQNGLAARNTSNGVHWQPIAGPSNIRTSTAKTKPATLVTAARMPAAVSRVSAPATKRPSPSVLSADGPKSKKAKEGGGQTTCVVCGRTPHHLVKDCPVVAQGPSSISNAMERLSKDPSQQSVVEVLTSVRAKQLKRMP